MFLQSAVRLIWLVNYLVRNNANATQYAKNKKKKIKNKVWTDDIHDDTALPCRCPASISTNFLSQPTLIPPIT